METVRLGGLYDGETKHQAGSLWDKSCIAPTIDTMQGGCREPMIIENIPCATSRVNKGEFASSQDLKLINVGQEEAGTILSRYWKGIEGDHSNAIIVAMRGRNPDNPSDRTVGSPTGQRLEPNSQGICNTLTSVQKDNLVMEKVLGVTLFESDNFGGWKVNKEELSPTIRAEKVCAGALETVKIKQATKDGYVECKIGGVADLSFPSSTTRRGRVQDNGDTCPTLMAGEQDICRIENLIIGGEQKHQAIKKDGVCTCLTSSMGTGGGYVPMIAPQYRIRKLTPKECWRLMDFKDEDFEKAAQANSNTQLYRQAGNSICKNVLVAILGQMIPGKEDVYKKLETR